ncbi:hypothetical protein BGZ80_008937 [Entomortierella chlamydospora]|uniref:Peroxisomal dehydratase n=1 Tax=Entomortierella chlamydospora TaxID=101097 RepID=A0A9P6MXH3_9FUNG|nr:hypothetical protein BGZ79_004420 [Entomortierella chlamydospora]KAG0016790.1 hypothetical protein BGZ80_008937 [Entomortierella chlamydospora]
MSSNNNNSYRVDVSKAVGFKFRPQPVVFTSRDLILYALSIGAKYPEELHFLYENTPNFAAFPTYPLVLGLKKDTHGISPYASKNEEAIPGVPPFDPNRLVHGDQSLQVLRPLPLGGEFELETTVTGVYDKGKGMVIERTTDMVDPKEPKGSRKPYVSMKGSAYVRGYGGWDGPKGPKPEAFDPPKDKAPDATYEDKTTDDIAVLYRLSGDYNPLHIDPAIAPKVGFKQPILHGLCTYGHAAHAVLKTIGNSDPNALKSITGRFTAPVFPGDTLVTKMWKVPADSRDEEKIIFQVDAKERNQTVINGGCVVLWAKGKGPQSKL